MTLAWDLERLRLFGNMRLGDPSEREEYLEIIERMNRRFKVIEVALR